MIAFCIGLGIVYLVVITTRTSFKVEGVFSIALGWAICYGLGHLVLAVLNTIGVK